MLRAATLILCLCLPLLAHADLTGQWRGDDGGRYYLHQVGDSLYWYGQEASAKPGWANAFFGAISANRIRGNWADVPRGQKLRNGELHLTIGKDGDTLTATHQTGGFKGRHWHRIKEKADE